MADIKVAEFENYKSGVSLRVFGDKKEGKNTRKACLDMGCGGPLVHGWLRLKEGGSANWYEFVAPLIKVDENTGDLVTQPKMNENGSFVNRRGEVVDYLGEADREYSTVVMDNGKKAYGTYAALSVKNSTVDNKPSESTFITAKLYTPFEAIKVAKVTYAALERKKRGDIKEKIDAAYDKERELKKECGSFVTLFINDRYEHGPRLLEEDGFEVRVKESALASEEPAP